MTSTVATFIGEFGSILCSLPPQAQSGRLCSGSCSFSRLLFRLSIPPPPGKPSVNRFLVRRRRVCSLLTARVTAIPPGISRPPGIVLFSLHQHGWEMVTFWPFPRPGRDGGDLFFHERVSHLRPFLLSVGTLLLGLRVASFFFFTMGKGPAGFSPPVRESARGIFAGNFVILGTIFLFSSVGTQEVPSLSHDGVNGHHGNHTTGALGRGRNSWIYFPFLPPPPHPPFLGRRMEGSFFSFPPRPRRRSRE